MQFAVIAAIAIAIAGVMFALQNHVPVAVTFLAWRFDSSLAMVLLLALAVGVIVAVLVSLPATLALRWNLRRQTRQVALLEKEIRALRDQALEHARRPRDSVAPDIQAASLLGMGKPVHPPAATRVDPMKQ
jgi:uncharacterized integral membrane protein